MKAAFANALTYLVTGTLIRLFWLFESTLDIRAWGMENLRLLKRQDTCPLLVIWHGKGFIPLAYFHHECLCLYASHGRDPKYGGLRKGFRWFTLRMIERMGYTVLDASQFTSEARGVLKFVQTLRDGMGGTIAADGPGGPSYEAKPGACFLAEKTGVTLVPVGAAISKGVRLDQWDQFEIPRMFSRGALVVETPIEVPTEASDEELEKARLALENALNRATRKAEEELGLRSDELVQPFGSSPTKREHGGAVSLGQAVSKKPWPQTILHSIIYFFFGVLIEDAERARAEGRRKDIEPWQLGILAVALLVIIVLGIRWLLGSPN